MPSFEGEVKPSAPCCKILWHAKKVYEVWKRDFVDEIRNFLRPVHPDLLPDGSSGRTARERSGGQIRSSPILTSFHHGSPCSYITWGMNNRPVGGCSSEA
jgi:hypothetical protein